MSLFRVVAVSGLLATTAAQSGVFCTADSSTLCTRAPQTLKTGFATIECNGQDDTCTAVDCCNMAFCPPYGDWRSSRALCGSAGGDGMIEGSETTIACPDNVCTAAVCCGGTCEDTLRNGEGGGADVAFTLSDCTGALVLKADLSAVQCGTMTTPRGGPCDSNDCCNTAPTSAPALGAAAASGAHSVYRPTAVVAIAAAAKFLA